MPAGQIFVDAAMDATTAMAVADSSPIVDFIIADSAKAPGAVADVAFVVAGG